MALLKLKAQLRSELGKKAKKLRERGYLPAVIYGYKIENKPLSINYKEFQKIYKIAGKNTFIELVLPDNTNRQVLIHEVIKHPITSQIISVDFYQPRLDKKIKIRVPLIFVGESDAVKNLGGVLVKNIYDLEVESLPNSLPHEIKIDISKLKTFEDVIKVSDIVISSDVKILAKENDIIALVVPPRSEEELAELEKEVVEKVEEVKVVEKEKEKEELEEVKEEVESEKKVE